MGREKGLLRYVMKDKLPAEIIDRKKSPYPKTQNPTYLKKVKEMLTEIMKKPNAPIKNLLNETYIWEIINTNWKRFYQTLVWSINDWSSTYGISLSG